VLLVDDEQRILDALRRTLRGKYAIETASSGPDGLTILADSRAQPEPIGVVVSDMMMPGMNGAEFLTRARDVAPDAVRMILSGQADLTSTIAAVNNADLFRFLTKPIEPATLTTALDAALRQYELVISERELLRSTLTGAVDVLVETLALASPLAYRRTARVRMLLTTVADEVGLADDWRLHVAAMLSQVGCIAVPAPVLERIEKGTVLSDEDRRMYLGHPELAMQLLGRIPRLEEVADWIGTQITDIDDLEPGELEDPSQACFGAVSAFLAGYDVGLGVREIGRRLTDAGRFGDDVVKAVLGAAQVLSPKGVPEEVKVAGIRPGMVLDQDVTTTTGLVLVRKGERVTEVLARRLENFALSVGVTEPIKVLVLGA
jgi:DNA-binding response OmpR family regulator